MGSLAKLSTVRSVPRAQLSRGASAGEDFWYVPDGWVSSLALAGVGLTPELALTLSHVYCAVDTISGDLGTMPCLLFEDLNEEGRRRVRFTDPGIGALAYRLRWQPNSVQHAKAFWSTIAWQYLLRPTAYAEIIYRRGSDSHVDQLVPRYPDRVEQQRLPNGRLRFKLTEADGSPRYVTQEEMFVVRNTSTDGLNAIGRIEYGGKALASGISLQDFTRNYFKKGATAALLATYKGGEWMEPEEEAALHGNISRYVAGVENAGGILLVPEDIDVTSLGVEPEKAQLLGLKNLSGRDIARLFKMPPHKLAIEGAQAGYASQVQAAQEYVSGTQMPLMVELQQSIYIHLIVARNYYAKFNPSHLLQADAKTRMEAHEIAIRARVYRPSDARVMEDMSPDEDLDRLSEQDHRSGFQREGVDNAPKSAGHGLSVRATLVLHDNALRVLRREREAVKKLATKHANNVEAWREGLRDFFADHAAFVGDTMRLPMAVARAYAARHGAALEDQGLVVMDDHWERLEAEDLVTLSLDPEPLARLSAPARSS